MENNNDLKKELAKKRYDELMKEFEEDCKKHDYSDPEMDAWFHEMLDKELKKSRRHRIAKVTGVAAGIVLAMGVALNGFTEVAYGESLIEIIRNSIEAGKFTICAIAPNDKSNKFEKYNDATICYKAESIETLYEKIIEDTEIDELFYIQELPSKYQQWTAKYNTKFQTLTIDSQQIDNYFHIYEELNYENVVSGTVIETEIASAVFNENLQVDINVVKQMDGVRHQGYYIEVFYNNKRLKIEGDGTLEEFENIAKNISLAKGN